MPLLRSEGSPLALASVDTFGRLADLSDESLALRFQAGDEAAMEELLARHQSMARSKARAWFFQGADVDDVVQEATIGIYKAARDFGTSHNVTFGAFAELCVTRQVITAVKTAARRKHQALNRYVSFTAGGDDSDESMESRLGLYALSDPAEEVVDRDSEERLLASLAGVLSQLESDVLDLYTQGHSYAEIGDELGRHAKAIDNAVQRIRRKLGTHLRLVTPEIVPV